MNTAINFGTSSPAQPTGPALASALRGSGGVQPATGAANPMAGMLLSQALNHNLKGGGGGWGDKLGSLFGDKPVGAAQYNVSPQQYETYHTQAQGGPNVSLPIGQAGNLFGGNAEYGGASAVPAGMEIPASTTSGGLSAGGGLEIPASYTAGGMPAAGSAGAGGAAAGDASTMPALYGLDSASMYGGAEAAGDLGAMYGAGAGGTAAADAAAMYGAGAGAGAAGGTAAAGGGAAAAAGTAEAADTAYLAALAALAAA